MTKTSLTFQLENGGRDVLVRDSVTVIPSVGHHLQLGDKVYLVTGVTWMPPKRPDRVGGIDVYAIVKLVKPESKAEE